jgi:hypothetical protein
MGGNPFKQIGKAVEGVFKGVGNLVGGVLGMNKEEAQTTIPTPPEEISTVQVDTSGTESRIKNNRRRSSFGGTFVASKGALGQGSGVGGKSFLGQ